MKSGIAWLWGGGQVLQVGIDLHSGLQEIPGQWRWDGTRWALRPFPAHTSGDSVTWAVWRAPCQGLLPGGPAGWNPDGGSQCGSLVSALPARVQCLFPALRSGLSVCLCTGTGAAGAAFQMEITAGHGTAQKITTSTTYITALWPNINCTAAVSWGGGGGGVCVLSVHFFPHLDERTTLEQ